MRDGKPTAIASRKFVTLVYGGLGRNDAAFSRLNEAFD
jgi:hypothetical protein